MDKECQCSPMLSPGRHGRRRVARCLVWNRGAHGRGGLLAVALLRKTIEQGLGAEHKVNMVG